VYVVGLDLSTVSTGVVIIKKGKVHQSHTLTAKGKDVHQRIYDISKGVRRILGRIKSNVDVAIIEAVYNIRWNTQSLLEVRGAVINILMEFGIPYEIISASEARRITKAIPKAKSGHPHTRDARKQFVRELVERKYGVKFKTLDESDAALLCLAWTTRSKA
jgi:Holliday junction resolvasome RuvABC endonuclease subunit